MNQWAMGITLVIILASIGVIFTVTQWELPLSNGTIVSGTPEWVLLQPQKCAEIPWRKEWSIESGKSYAEFPVGEELSILGDYYSGKGIPILDVTLTYQSTDATCTQCGCPESFVYALLVHPSDAARLAVSGFTILDAEDPAIFTGPFFRQSSTQPIPLVKSSECEGLFATHTVIDGLLGSKKDSCYIQAAISEKDPGVCAKVYSIKAQHTCYTEVAVSQKNGSVCDYLSSQPKDSCISSVAGITQKPELCIAISDSTAQYLCELGATQKE
ncbi:MAG: hypothetical protein AABW68_00300 [archaeon]